MFNQKETSYGCLDTPGFKAAGVHCNIRNKADGRLDLALLFSEMPCTAAGVFTMNKMAAAPVRLDRELLKSGGKFRAIVANSGNANACTGKQGEVDAATLCAWTASALGCSPEEVLVCSTGRIGERLPMEKIRKGIQSAVSAMDDSAESSMQAADAILTSDTRRKVCSCEIQTQKGPVWVSGMAKGAGMIEPNMATMLAFLCTDAVVEAKDLQGLLAGSVQGTFNAITVDGDESTNDTVLMLANGHSSISLAPGDPDWEAFAGAVERVCLGLAKKIVGDGEKITKVVEISIEGALNPKDAENAARAVANSLLVKSSWYGNDPNWGRVMDALGYSGAELSEDSVSMHYGDPEAGETVPVYEKGTVHHDNKPAWKSIVSRKTFRILIDLGQGSETCTVWSTDLTEDYVHFNKSE